VLILAKNVHQSR